MRRHSWRTVILTVLLLSSIAVPPTTVRAAEACFQETGFCIQGRFLDYWTANGGLARNGYPLSVERRELLEDGKEYIVQYFERVRMELHPENAAPYDVLLGQFGRRIFTYRGGSLSPTDPLPGQHYFPETGHNLGGRFLTYWQANGGLAQFGYPLSEEQIDYGLGGVADRYQVQYFERARLEYHPENEGTPYAVLLGQFGREILAEQDLLAGDFGRLYVTDERVRARLGRPRAAAVEVPGALLTFERGTMLWRGDQHHIYALCGDERAGQLVVDGYARTVYFLDTWVEGQAPAEEPAPPPGRYSPQRGFGKIWREGSGARAAFQPPLPYVRDCLGYALTPAELGYRLAIQDFAHGWLLSSPDRRAVYVVIDASAKCCISGDYERIVLPPR